MSDELRQRFIDGIAEITYRVRGTVQTWRIAANLAEDTEETIRAHLVRWIPEAEFLGVQFSEIRRGGG